MSEPFNPAPYSLIIRECDGKCRAVRDGRPLTGWCSDALNVVAAVRKKEAPKPTRTPADLGKE